MDREQSQPSDKHCAPALLAFVLIGGIMLMLPNGMSLREQRLINFEIFVLIGLAVYVFQVNRMLGALLGFVAATLPFHQAIDPGIMLAITCYALLYLAVTSRPWNVEWFWNIFCVAALLNVLWQAFQYFGLWIMQIPVGDGLAYVGILSNTNETSAFLAICLPCFFRKGWRWLIPIPVAGLILSVSIGGMVAAALAGLIYLALNFRYFGFKRLLVIVLAAIALVSVAMVQKQIQVNRTGQTLIERYKGDRFRYWVDMVPIAAMKPLGWGMGQFKFVMPIIVTPTLMPPQTRIMLYNQVGDKRGFEDALQKVSGGNPAWFAKARWSEIWIEAHNEYLETWFSLGIGGLLLLLGTIAVTLRKGADIPRYGFLISCISAIWFFSWQICPLAIITTVFMGVLHAETA